jgi:hypothetical protein
MTKPTYITVQNPNTPAAINNPGTGDAHWTRIIWIAPRIRKSVTEISPLEIHEVFHPDDKIIRQNLKGCPK